MPYMREVVWNNIKYPSVKEAAESLGVTWFTMWWRLEQGYVCDADMNHGSGNIKSVTWNNINYKSVRQAARANNISPAAMSIRIKNGYTCDADLRSMYTHKKSNSFLDRNIRRAKKRSLPNNFTVDDWEYALEYFNGCCAVCNRQLHDLFGTHYASQDHWIPINYDGADNPGTVPENIVPLCHGVDGCNNSKHDKMPDVWLKEKFGSRIANEIAQRIETYFNHIDKTKSA